MRGIGDGKMIVAVQHTLCSPGRSGPADLPAYTLALQDALAKEDAVGGLGIAFFVNADN